MYNLNVLQENFLTIGMAKVATSAYEAFDLGILTKRKRYSCSKQRQSNCTAKKHAILMAEAGYTQPVKRKDVLVLGNKLGNVLSRNRFYGSSNYISEHDKKIANKLAYVMAGGDLSEPTTVTEQYLIGYRA